MSFVESLTPLLDSSGLNLSPQQKSRALGFAQALYTENQTQNLTRIEGAQEFIDGHLVDVLELFKTEWLGQRVLDIGSGSGVPGLLAAALDTQTSREWVLTESETHKAEYLSRTAALLGLKQVSVYGERVENVIKSVSPDTVIARAVGTVDKMAAWIWNCSTWNNLVLFKSRGWKDEWERARITKFGKKLTVTHTHEYSVGDKYRVLVKLTRT